jgi:hypothetical protein
MRFLLFFRNVKASKSKTPRWDARAPVVDWKALSNSDAAAGFPRGRIGHPDPTRMEDSELIEFALAIAWRFVAGVGDPANRNYVWSIVEKKVYSVDEDDIFNPKKISKQPISRFKQDSAAPIRRVVRSQWESLYGVISKWPRILANFSNLPCREQVLENVERIYKSPDAFLGVLLPLKESVGEPTAKRQRK